MGSTREEKWTGAGAGSSCLGMKSLRPVHAIGLDTQREVEIRRDQKDKTSRAADLRQLTGYLISLRRAEMPVDQPASCRQALGQGKRIRGPRGIGQGKQTGRMARASIAVCQACQSRGWGIRRVYERHPISSG